MLKRILLAAAVSMIAAPALAQTPPATIGQQYIPAPWWMRDPVIASIGYVRVEIPANRARFNIGFQVVERTAEAAAAAAAVRASALSQSLASIGAERVRVVTTIDTTPLYDQYRDSDGNLVDNERADKIERYQSVARIEVDVQDVSIIEAVYAAALSAQPTELGAVEFSLQPENAWLANLQTEAVKNAADRARRGAEAAGASLGAVRVIDPTGRACATDVLTGWGSRAATGDREDFVTVDEIVVTGSRLRQSSALLAPSNSLALQPPLRELTSQACVVYGLN